MHIEIITSLTRFTHNSIIIVMNYGYKSLVVLEVHNSITDTCIHNWIMVTLLFNYVYPLLNT